MEIDPGAEDDAVLAPARSEARALPTEDKDLGPLAYAGGHETARVVLIRFPAGVRSALGQTVEARAWSATSDPCRKNIAQRVPGPGHRNGLRGLTASWPNRAPECLCHPGGPKVLAAYAAAYGMDPSAFCWSRDVIARFGNMSSVTVLYVLADYRAVHPPGRSGYGVVSALGPAFSSETLLLQL